MHYKPLAERLEFMKNQLEKLKIEYTVISEEPDIAWIRDDINVRLEKMKSFRNSYHDKISLPAASLAWKHLLFLEKAMNSKRVCLALEDDAILSDNFIDIVNSIIENNTWDVVFPGSGCNLKANGSGLIKVPHPASKCTDIYLITPESARKIYSTMKDFIDFAIDWELNYQMMYHNLNVYWHEPPIARQGSQNGTMYSSINGKKENLFK